MPLQLGDVSTERAQLVTWDPEVPAEADESKQRITELVCQGFRLLSLQNGEAHLIPPARDPHQGMMRILSQNGDDRLVWDRRNPDEVREAAQKYAELVEDGYTAYVATSDGSRGHRIDMFDPALEEVVMVPSRKLIPG